MDSLSIVVVILSVIFVLYRTILKIAIVEPKIVDHKIVRKEKKSNIKNENINNITFSKNSNVDTRFYTGPTFEFPNLQSGTDLKIYNSGSDLCNEQKDIIVHNYCTY